MKAEDTYLKFVRWELEDNLYVGYCPDLFPWGGVCHGESEEDAFRMLCELVREEVDDLRRLEAIAAECHAGNARRDSGAGVIDDLLRGKRRLKRCGYNGAELRKKRLADHVGPVGTKSACGLESGHFWGIFSVFKCHD